MRGRIRDVTAHSREYLSSAWEFGASAADTVTSPAEFADAALQWSGTTVPATAAASLRALNRWSLDDPARRFDAEDWWYRCRFPAPRLDANSSIFLGFDGLATIAEVWLNGALILASENMFLAHEVCVDTHLRFGQDNDLAIRFRALDKLLTGRRPRPRWRTPMVENQQLRWFRTTLLGRTPGWSPPAAAVGPWRPIWLERRQHIDVENVDLAASIVDQKGRVVAGAKINALGSANLVSAELIVERDQRRYSSMLAFDKEAALFSGQVTVPQPELWWPHTHGNSAMYRATVVVVAAVGSAEFIYKIELGSIGFRTIALKTDAGDFKVVVNDVTIFCRGACWTPLDPVTLTGSHAQYSHAIQQVREAGMNMLRIGGTMTYECQEFLDLCDENGILLWQDFMFANMDYPEDDAKFAATVAREIEQELAKLTSRPCLAILCGNSEGEQQASMWGATKDRWAPKLFHETIPALIKHRSAALYWPSSAHGGSFPHQNNTGTTSYYGVGAYLRPLEDARRSEVRFATECLAFANIPEDECLAAMPGGVAIKVHHPQWKARTPRDLGAGWDFDDVRDFYLQQLANVDPLKLRYADHDRYVELSRSISGEVAHATFSEWRRKRSLCGGALIWFLKDLWPGAGWGIVDSHGQPKALYYFLKRILQPICVAITDEGCNGLALHVANERAEPLCGALSLTLYREGKSIVASGRVPLDIQPRGVVEIAAAELFDGFYDLSYAYRFGPPAYDVAVATINATDDTPLAEACHFPVAPAWQQFINPEISAKAIAQDDRLFCLTLGAKRFAHNVTVRVDGYQADDQYFHLLPGRERIVMLKPSNLTARPKSPQGTVQTFNRASRVQIEFP